MKQRDEQNAPAARGAPGRPGTRRKLAVGDALTPLHSGQGMGDRALEVGHPHLLAGLVEPEGLGLEVDPATAQVARKRLDVALGGVGGATVGDVLVVDVAHARGRACRPRQVVVHGPVAPQDELTGAPPPDAVGDLRQSRGEGRCGHAVASTLPRCGAIAADPVQVVVDGAPDGRRHAGHGLELRARGVQQARHVAEVRDQRPPPDGADARGACRAATPSGPRPCACDGRAARSDGPRRAPAAATAAPATRAAAARDCRAPGGRPPPRAWPARRRPRAADRRRAWRPAPRPAGPCRRRSRAGSGASRSCGRSRPRRRGDGARSAA